VWRHYSSRYIVHSWKQYSNKTVHDCLLYLKEEMCCIHAINYDCITFTSRVHHLNANTAQTEGIQNHSIFNNEFYLLLNIVMIIWYAYIWQWMWNRNKYNMNEIRFKSVNNILVFRTTLSKNFYTLLLTLVL